MSFCTSIHCMDGRIQEPVINYLKRKFWIKYVDTITAAGPNKILSENKGNPLLESIFNQISISINQHKSQLIAISGHHGCLGNPESKSKQIEQLKKAEKILSGKYPHIKIVKLWIGENLQIEEI